MQIEAARWAEKSIIYDAIMDCSLIVCSDHCQWIGSMLFDEDARLSLCQTLRTLMIEQSDKKTYLCHEIRSQQREAQFVNMMNDAGLHVRQERTLTYLPWFAGDEEASPSGFVYNGFGKGANVCSRISSDGPCLTTQLLHSYRWNLMVKTGMSSFCLSLWIKGCFIAFDFQEKYATVQGLMQHAHEIAGLVVEKE